NPGLAIYGVLLTMVDGKKAHAQRVVATVRHSLKGQVPVFETEIAQHVALKEAAEAGQTILRYQGRGAAAEMYRDLGREVARAGRTGPASRGRACPRAPRHGSPAPRRRARRAGLQASPIGPLALAGPHRQRGTTARAANSAASSKALECRSSCSGSRGHRRRG